MKEQLQTAMAEIFSPLLAMGNGKDLANPGIGEEIRVQYRNLLQEFHPEVVARAVRNACDGREFRPSPSAVREHCKMVLEANASRFIDAAQRSVPWTVEERERYLGLPNDRERYNYWTEKWQTALGVSGTAWLSARGDLERARMLHGWDRIEKHAPDTNIRMDRLLEQAAAMAMRRIGSNEN